jgi:hypothetical protein
MTQHAILVIDWRKQKYGFMAQAKLPPLSSQQLDVLLGSLRPPLVNMMAGQERPMA